MSFLATDSGSSRIEPRACELLIATLNLTVQSFVLHFLVLGGILRSSTSARAGVALKR